MKRLFTGIQPTGSLHIGNYFGAVRNWVTMQHEYAAYFSIVDYHAITIQYEPAQMQENIFDLALGLFSCGLDIDKTTLFVQSEVTGHAELAWIFNTVTPLGDLERMTQFKDKSRQNRGNVNVGLLDYPVLQAADILLYKGEVVPVGEDQVQHIELTREIARKFNGRYGDTFPEPEAKLTETPRIMGLDGESKMSKSRGNHIALFEGREEVWQKIAPAKTDPARVRRTDPGTPEKCNIYSYHTLFSPPEVREEVAQGCRTAGIGCIDCKKKLLDAMMTTLDPMRERYEDLSAHPRRVRDALDRSAESCRADARETITEVKEKLGLKPVWTV